MAGIFILLSEALRAGDRFLIGPLVSYSSLYSVLFLVGIIGFVVMVPCLFFVYKDFSHLRGSDWFKIVFIGLGVGGLYTNLLFVNYAKLYETNQDDLILVMHFIQPIFLFISATFPSTKLQFLTSAAFLIALTGAYLICFGITDPIVVNKQIMMIVISGALLHTGGTVFAKQLLGKIRPLTLTYLRIFVSFIVMLLVIGFFEAKTTDQLIQLITTPMSIGGLKTYVIFVVLFLGIVSYVGGVLIYYSALKKLRLMYVPTLEFSYIIFVLLYFFATYGYGLDLTSTIGMILISIAVALQIFVYTSKNNARIGKYSS